MKLTVQLLTPASRPLPSDSPLNEYLHDRLIKRKDLFGSSTYYKYDPLVNKISQTDFPKITSLDGGSQDVKTSSKYDSFGRETTYTDANGNTTCYAYNVYGSVSEIRHPSGGKETFRYAKNGNLNSHTDPDELTIQYENDILERVLKKTYISKEGTTLAEETFTYSGLQLTSETDKEGNLKRYFYDGAGRKIREEFCGRVTEFAYDSLNRLATVYKYNGDDALVTHYERDLEDRITCETKTDLSGRVLYKIEFSYDRDGNRESITRNINGEEALELFAYDPFRRKMHYRDALGYKTHTSYDENFTNALGQKTLQIKTIDPNGTQTFTTLDALNRKLRVEKLGPSGQMNSCYERIHDPQGNLILQKDHIYEDGRFRSTQAVCYFYTPDHQLKSIRRGYGTRDARETQYTYSPAGKMTVKVLPDGIGLFYSYHPLGFLTRLDSSDGEIAHSFTRNRLGDLLVAFDEKQNLKIKREVDAFGNVISEVFPYGIPIVKTYDDFSRPLSLSIAGHGHVRYAYDPLFLREVERASEHGRPLYKHIFKEYDQSGNIVQETLIGNLGTISYTTDVIGQRTQIAGPYFSQGCTYDSTQNLVSSTTDRVESRYQYDDTSQMIGEEVPRGNATYGNDSLYNRTEKNGALYEINALNELLFDGKTVYEHDLRGDQVLKKTDSGELSFGYDPLNQLIEVKSKEEKIEFIYDPLGRRLAKVISNKAGHGWEESDREYYIYDGEEEIGSFKSSTALESFRVLSTHPLPKTISVETEGKIFAPLTDVQGNIRRLIDIQSKTLAASYDFSAFGEKLQPNAKEGLSSPWQFASKRFDPSLGLIYFGKRYYDPKIGRWITTDPVGFKDSSNPYQYALNNPFRYYDPNGESLGGYFLGLGEIALGSAIMVGGFALEVATVGGFTIGIGLTTSTGAALIGAGLATTTYHAQDIKFPDISWKNTDVYVPDRPLPNTPDGVHVPDTDVPHTQLGTKEGRKGKYPQAREFDENGNPVRDIDFTDHGRPQDHPNPHQHEHKPNPTGGTRIRDPKGQSVTDWNYS